MGTSTQAVPLRRAAALGVDLVIPCAPAAVVVAVAWSVVRPDLAQEMAGIGAALVVALSGATGWLAAFIANDVVLAASRGRTLGERLYGFHLDVPGSTGARSLKLGARAALRLGVAVVVLSVLGLATQHVGENVIGVVVGVVVSAGFLVVTCTIGAEGPTTGLERMCRIPVRDQRRADPDER